MAAQPNMIEVSDLRKHYGPIQAVNGISFSIRRGEIVGFLGPNGAGKSTTMKMLTGFLAPTAGEARVAGHDVANEPMAVRQAIGYLPEDTPLYKSMTVLEFLQFIAAIREVPPSRRKERLRTVAEICGIKDRLGQIIGTLSKGYRQRVGLAQALVHDPDILILDEPTSGLDPNQIAEIREVIRALGKDKTLILSTHVLSEVEATCDRVIIIDQGSVVGDGSIEVLAKAREAQAGFVVTVEADAEPAQIGARLKSLAHVKSVEAIHAPLGPTFVVTPEEGHDPRLDIMRACVEKGWVLLSMTPKTASLEDIFRNLTHAGLSAPAVPPKDAPAGGARAEEEKAVGDEDGEDVAGDEADGSGKAGGNDQADDGTDGDDAPAKAVDDGEDKGEDDKGGEDK